MRRAEWSVSTMYSWPSAIAVAAIASIVGPAVAPRASAGGSRRCSASRYTCPASVIDTCDLGLDLGQIRRLVAGERLGDHRRRRRSPMPSRSVSVLLVGPFGELVRAGVADDVEGPTERLRLEARVVGPIEAVDHPQQRLLRRHLDGHRGDGTRPGGDAPANRPATERLRSQHAFDRRIRTERRRVGPRPGGDLRTNRRPRKPTRSATAASP